MSRDQMPPSSESQFFRALGKHLPGQVLYNGDHGAATAYLGSLSLQLPNGHWHMELPSAVGAALDALLRDFGGARRAWADADLGPQVSGVITAPPLGPCVVQWDGAEHFSPYRLASLRRLGKLAGSRFPVTKHAEYCTCGRCFAAFWQASGLPPSLLPQGQVISSTGELAATLARMRRRLSQSSYVRPVAGFNFVGGRIAQRAYHDALLDCAHLTNSWRRAGMRPVIRVAVWDVLPEGRDETAQAELERAVETLVTGWRQVNAGGPGNSDAGDSANGRRSSKATRHKEARHDAG